jgi:hypothetical protein
LGRHSRLGESYPNTSGSCELAGTKDQRFSIFDFGLSSDGGRRTNDGRWATEDGGWRTGGGERRAKDGRDAPIAPSPHHPLAPSPLLALTQPVQQLAIRRLPASETAQTVELVG